MLATLDSSSDEGDRDTTFDERNVVAFLSVANVAGGLDVDESGGLAADELEHLEVILHLVDVDFHLGDGLGLAGNELFLVLDVLVDGVEKKLLGSFLLLGNVSDVLLEGLDVLWPVDTNAHFLALGN